jgi:hypothetical protein
MFILKVLGMIFLGIWLILTSLVALAGIALSPFLVTIVNLLALVAGVLILITVSSHLHCGTCEKKDM